MFSKFFVDGRFSDFEVVAPDGKAMKVHRIVLSSRSKFFDSLFSSGAKEVSEGRADFRGKVADPHAVFGDVLRWMYTNEIALTTENAVNVRHIASFLMSDELRTIVLQFISSDLREETGAVYVLEAAAVDDMDVVQISSKFVNKTSFDKVDLSHLPIKSMICLLSQSSLGVESEVDVLRICIEYYERHRSDIRESEACQLFGTVRWTDLPDRILANLLEIDGTGIPRDMLIGGIRDRLHMVDRDAEICERRHGPAPSEQFSRVLQKTAVAVPHRDFVRCFGPVEFDTSLPRNGMIRFSDRGRKATHVSGDSHCTAIATHPLSVMRKSTWRVFVQSDMAYAGRDYLLLGITSQKGALLFENDDSSRCVGMTGNGQQFSGEGLLCQPLSTDRHQNGDELMIEWDPIARRLTIERLRTSTKFVWVCSTLTGPVYPVFGFYHYGTSCTILGSS